MVRTLVVLALATCNQLRKRQTLAPAAQICGKAGPSMHVRSVEMRMCSAVDGSSAGRAEGHPELSCEGRRTSQAQL
eukprot:354803-Chlamydomonas_euryale.AAC.3